MTIQLPVMKTGAADARYAELARSVKGTVRTDRLIRTMYATDASIYSIEPDAVVCPANVADVVATVTFAGREGIAVTARGAATGLTGGAVNRGISLDCSRYLDRILAVDVAARTATVEPGVVLDHLNMAVRPYGLMFAPDVAPSSRATIGGMIANNSCGAHSVRYGRTVDHVRAVEVVLADGSLVTWGKDVPRGENPLAKQCEQVLASIATEYEAEIRKRFPKVLRSNAGYALDRLRVGGGGGCNPETIICGSEGTLGVVTKAVLGLVPLPAHSGLVAVHFQDMLESLASVPLILEHSPAAIELIDQLILDAAAGNPGMAGRRGFLQGKPGAILVVEFFGDSLREVDAQLDLLVDRLKLAGVGYAHVKVTDPAAQADVWRVRTSGLGLLMSRPGDEKAYAFVEDTAVSPVVLRDFIEQFKKILDEEGIAQAGYYAHASVGCLHVKPILNLSRKTDIEKLVRIADRVSSLAVAFGGTFTGEHGDGIVRSSWLKKLYGPTIMGLFKQTKQVFDPKGIFNPGKIVDPLPFAENLRQGENFDYQHVNTMFNFSAYGGMGGMASMCTGVGQCRQRMTGTMCPSFMATGDEMHTTRARANALRVALSNRGSLRGLSDPALEEVMDLCLSCKACKTQCPTGTDMARLKSEWLFAKHLRDGVPFSTRFFASAASMAKLGSRFAPVSNWLGGLYPVRWLMERYAGVDCRIPPPKFVGTTFRQWFQRRKAKRQTSVSCGTVVYFPDTWTNYVTPSVGQAAVRLLEAAGYQVQIPRPLCCGRPLITKGLLYEAKQMASELVDTLTEYVDQGYAIVGSESSCISALVDEIPDLLSSVDSPYRQNAVRVAARTKTVSQFLAHLLRKEPDALRWYPTNEQVYFHGHCHQKSLWGTVDDMYLLRQMAGQDRAVEMNTGCCGMAGSFGHEKEHYDIAKAIGEERLFPHIRKHPEARFVVSGFSCSEQIAHHTGVDAVHVLELLAERLVGE